MNNKIKVISKHGGEMASKNYNDSGFDLRCVGYRRVLYGKLSKPIYFDESSSKFCIINPNETMLLLTGIQLKLPSPTPIMAKGKLVAYWMLECQIRGRSGLSLKNDTNVKFGTGDNCYNGEYGVIFNNQGKKDFMVEEGDRIGQLVFNEVFKPTKELFETVDAFDEVSERGSTGFGDSGIK